MKEIQLTQGMVALVDDYDYEYINQFKWHADKGLNTFYAKSYDKQNITCGIRMHVLISGIKNIDHIDRNGLNNQRTNLRKCTHSQNMLNSGFRKNVASKYKGVRLDKKTNHWRATITMDYKQINLGCYKNEDDAAIAYDKKAIELYGEFAYLNFKTTLI